jgi:hypothetical protein
MSSHFHRLVLASFVYITDTVALVSALCLIPMYPDGDPTRIVVVLSLLLGGFSFFGLLSWLGGRSIRVVSSNDLDVEVVSSDGLEKGLGVEGSRGECSESSSNDGGESPTNRTRRISHHYY